MFPLCFPIAAEDRGFILEAVSTKVMVHSEGTWELELQIPHEVARNRFTNSEQPTRVEAHLKHGVGALLVIGWARTRVPSPAVI